MNGEIGKRPQRGTETIGLAYGEAYGSRVRVADEALIDVVIAVSDPTGTYADEPSSRTPFQGSRHSGDYVTPGLPSRRHTSFAPVFEIHTALILEDVTPDGSMRSVLVGKGLSQAPIEPEPATV